MPAERRVQAADAFWRDSESPEIEAQHLEALGTMARRLNFRPRTLQTLPVERRAKLLAQIADLSDAVATRALIAYHFQHQRPLMSAFLDALGIEHADGLITAETVPMPDPDRLGSAVETVRSSYPVGDVELYLRTLTALDGETWTDLDRLLGPRT
jgi:hypothetical protein